MSKRTVKEHARRKQKASHAAELATIALALVRQQAPETRLLPIAGRSRRRSPRIPTGQPDRLRRRLAQARVDISGQHDHPLRPAHFR